MKQIADRKNHGKTEFTLLPFDCLEECAKALKQATDSGKYPDLPDGRANWELLWGDKTMKVTLDCALRHIYARLKGDIRDKESNRMHTAHAVLNLLFLIRYDMENETKEDK